MAHGAPPAIPSILNRGGVPRNSSVRPCVHRVRASRGRALALAYNRRVMTPFVFPSYSGQGIVNLMQSITQACGGRALPAAACPVYPELDVLPAATLAQARHIVLLVIDGLGQRTLASHPACANLRRHALGTMSSVFPSTTASAITTFMSGLAPAQHALTGWHMHFEEIGQTLAILPLSARAPDTPLPLAPTALAERLFEQPSLFSRLARESWVLAPRSIVDSAFNARHARGASRLAYETPGQLFAQLAQLLHDARSPRYIYAYVADLDSRAHRFGCASEQAQRTLAELDALFGELVDAVRGSDSWLIVTADHGFIDSPAQHVVCLDDHPRLAALLARPLCGERRAAYCYVATDKRAAFEDYVREHLAHCAELRVSADLIAAGCFGRPPFHAQLAARVGDYTLLMKDDWTITDWLPGERRYVLVGVHGGARDAEMTVPLIAVRT